MDSDHEEGGVNDWCLVCKDGGDLIECEVRECGRVYHSGCLKPIPARLENWQCPRHSCYGCKRSPSVALCCSCPKASCSECLDDLGFVRIRDGYGFCPLCWDLAKYVEDLTRSKPKMDPGEYGLFQHCKEYYWIVKEQYGFTLDDLVAVKEKQREMRGRKKRKNQSLDKSDEGKAFQKKKLNSAGNSQKEVVVRDTKILVPALTPNNVQRIYLTRNVVQKLLLEPDTFEEKVRGTLVGIELPKKPRSNKTVRQLVQITGVTKTSLQNDQICIKLQAKGRQDDISVDMVSDMDFLEIVCQDLRQQVKDGLIKMPDVEEFKRMAKVLSEVMVDDFIVRETRLIQERMSRANEKGRREEFLLLAQKKKDLQTYTKKLQLIWFFQDVEVEEVSADTLPGNNKVDSDDIMDGEKQKGPTKLLQQDSLDLKRDKSSVGHGSKQHGMMWTEHRQVVDGNTPVEETMLINAADDMLITANKPVEETMLINAADHMLITTDHMLTTADHSNMQSSMVEKECDAMVLSRDALVEQKRVDVMLEEFESNCRVVKEDKQLVVLSTEGSSVALRLASLEQKVNRILQHLETIEDGAKKSVPK